MSQNHDIDSDPVRQDNSNKNSEVDHKSEFYRLACIVLRLVIIAISEACARNWGRRLEMMGQSTFIPEEGYGDTVAIAAAMNLSERGAEEMITRNNTPSVRPGQSRVFAFRDVLQKFEPAEITPPPPGKKRPAKKK
jgi:hypothetical protein